MRQFVVIGHDAPTDPDFALDDLAGGAGRLDLLARCVTAALLRSHGIREDVRVHLVIADEVTISVHGDSIRRLNPDERSTAARIRTALEHKGDAIGHQPVEASPGVKLRRLGLAETLDRLTDGGDLLVLDGAGEPATQRALPTEPIFVLSDHRDFSEAEDEMLNERGADRVSLGPVALHADQAITVAHNWLDTEGFTRY